MARSARAVGPGVPHRVTQHGNWRQQTFFEDGDKPVHNTPLAEHCRAAGGACPAWCPIRSHVRIAAS